MAEIPLIVNREWRLLRHRCRGVSLVELIAVIAILGIVAAMSSVGVREYVTSYTDSRRRAEIVDMADTALRRMSRDLQRALPNSCRVPSGQSTSDLSSTKYVELLMTRTGGQYRSTTAGGLNILDTSGADTDFNVVGALQPNGNEQILAGDLVVVKNTGLPSDTSNNAYNHNNSSVCGTSTSPGCNSATVASVAYTGANTASGTETYITFSGRQFPSGALYNRFSVVSGPVTYRCTSGISGGNGTGQLLRYSGYPIALAQPTPPGVAGAVLAENVTGCILACQAPVAGTGEETSSTGWVWLVLEITRYGQPVRLYHAIQINNFQ